MSHWYYGLDPPLATEAAALYKMHARPANCILEQMICRMVDLAAIVDRVTPEIGP